MLWLCVTSMAVLVQRDVGNTTLNEQPTVAYAIDQNLEEPVRLRDVEVRARRGSALVPPEIELSGAEIDSLGAWDVGEVLSRLNESLDIGEAPMVTINGKRVANAGVFYGFPPDALVRAEVLPLEATALYGGQPGQRVVNLVLQRRFSSYDGRMTGSRPTQGGTSSVSGDIRRSGIVDENSHQLGLRATRDTALRVSERDLEQLIAGPAGGEVTLRPHNDAVAANASFTRSLGDWSTVFSLNGQARESRFVSRIGGNVVESQRLNQSLGGAAGFSGNLVGWNMLTNLHGQISSGKENGFNNSQNENQTLGINTAFNRSFNVLPAGAVAVNLGGNFMGSRSISDRSQQRSKIDFRVWEGRGSLTVPLTKANAESVSGRLFGDLQATLGASVRETGGGEGGEVNGTLDWTPFRGLRLNTVWSSSLDSVSDIQKSEPLYYDVTRVVFDFRTGEVVEIIPILGGNPDLKAPRSDRLSLTASVGPFTAWGLSGSVGYQRAKSSDGIGSLPDLTEDVELAFPDRFKRDADGRLISIDYRPLNLGANLTEGVSSSISFSLPRSSRHTSREATILRVALSHSFRMKNTVTLLTDQFELDRLKGDGGGVARQDARITLDARRGRLGLNALARWQDGYRTRRVSGVDSSGDLVTEPFAAVNLKLSYQMTTSATNAPQDQGSEAPRRRSNGLQLNLEVENLFDARPEVRLGNGLLAPGYGRDFPDPIGRTLKLTLQKRF